MSSLRGRYFLAAILSVIFSLGISLLVTTEAIFDLGLHMSFMESLALAGVLSMTSLGIVAKVLADDGQLKGPIGLQIFTVVIIAELIVLLVIGFSIGEHKQEVPAVGILVLLARIAGFTVVSWVLMSRVLPPVMVLFQQVIVRFALDDITVDDTMDRTQRHPGPELSVGDLTEHWMSSQQRDYVVIDNDEIVGIVSVEMLRYLPKGLWDETPLEKVMRRDPPLAWPDEHIEDVLQRMSEKSVSVMPIVERESEKFLGSVTRSNIVELMIEQATGEH